MANLERRQSQDELKDSQQFFPYIWDNHTAVTNLNLDCIGISPWPVDAGYLWWWDCYQSLFLMTPLCKRDWDGSVSLMSPTARHLLPCWRNDSAQIWQNNTADHQGFRIPPHWILWPWSNQHTFGYCLQSSLRPKIQRVLDPLVWLLFLWQELLHEDPQTTFLCTPHDAGVAKDARFSIN